MNAVKEAIKERDDYIKTHPHLKKYQKEINYVMSQINNSKGRMEALAQLAEGKMIEFQVQMKLLNDKIKEITKNINEEKDK